MRPFKAYDSCWYIVEGDKVLLREHFKTEAQALERIKTLQNPKANGEKDASLKMRQAKQIVWGNESKRYSDK